jgi:potassium channel LctB
MGRTKRPSGWRQALFDRPVLKLSLVLLFIAVAATLAQAISIPLVTFIAAPLIIIAVAYAIVLAGHIGSLYLIRRPLERLFNARDLFSLLASYVMFIVGILLVISLCFKVVQDLKLGYLSYDPTVKLSEDMIEQDAPSLSEDYLYFTAVTFFSVGYGDVCPVGLCKPLAMLTAFTGNAVTVVLMAIVVSAYLSRRAKDSDQVPSAIGLDEWNPGAQRTQGPPDAADATPPQEGRRG